MSLIIIDLEGNIIEEFTEDSIKVKEKELIVFPTVEPQLMPVTETEVIIPLFIEIFSEEK